MTEKQKSILTKYLNERNLKKLEGMKSVVISSFIELILKNRWFHAVCGEMCSIPKFEMKPSEVNPEYIENIEQIVNKRRKEFGLLEDEYAHVSKVFYLDAEHQWYQLKQTWFKGMSESESSRCCLVKYYHSPERNCSRCIPFEGIYNELFDIGVYSMNDLVNFFYNKAKEAKSVMN